jgi:hypothetical protein
MRHNGVIEPSGLDEVCDAFFKIEQSITDSAGECLSVLESSADDELLRGTVLEPTDVYILSTSSGTPSP